MWVFSDLKFIGFAFTSILLLDLVTFLLPSDSIILQLASHLKTLGH